MGQRKSQASSEPWGEGTKPTLDGEPRGRVARCPCRGKGRQYSSDALLSPVLRMWTLPEQQQEHGGAGQERNLGTSEEDCAGGCVQPRSKGDETGRSKAPREAVVTVPIAGDSAPGG